MVNDVIDRLVDFRRSRHTRCSACGHEQVFDLDWLQRWSYGGGHCPGCGADCTGGHATQVVADPDDVALDDHALARLSWWHTSTHPDWPATTYSPGQALDQLTVKRMGGAEKVARWEARQRAKALHIGTYESAVHNMLRRMSDQPERGSQFYLYRVRLKPDVVPGPGCDREVVDWMGNAELAEVCPPGTDLTRYVNEHEDPGGISLALGRSAIQSVQRLAIPLPQDGRPPWWEDAVGRLRRASAIPVTDQSTGPLRRATRPPIEEARLEIATELSEQFPVNLRDEVVRGARDWGIADTAAWCDYLAGLVALVDVHEAVMEAIRDQPVVQIVSTQ